MIQFQVEVEKRSHPLCGLTINRVNYRVNSEFGHFQTDDRRVFVQILEALLAKETGIAEVLP